MGRKRPSSEEDDHGGKRGTTDQSQQAPQPPQQHQGGSKLWEKNKMLASLLAKQPSTPATIPPIPASVISATPQDKMPRLVRPPTAWSGGSVRPNARLANRPHSLPTSASPSAPSLSSQVGLWLNFLRCYSEIREFKYLLLQNMFTISFFWIECDLYLINAPTRYFGSNVKEILLLIAFRHLNAFDIALKNVKY